jgi:uncharacterized protein (DUF58 family)
MPNVFDPQVIGRIKQLEVRSLRLVESFMAGSHKSRLLGISTEFAQHRQYVPGDDPKHLDWKVFAKTDRFYIKQYEAETNMRVTFLVDTSNSMFFQSEHAALSKYEYAATVASSLAYLLLQQKDTFGLMLFCDDVHTTLRPRGSTSHFRNICTTMEAAEAGGKTSLYGSMSGVAGRLKSKGMVFVVSDFVDDLDELNMALGQLSFSGQDVCLVHVEDPVERDFPFSGQTIFLGLEEEGKLLCEPRDLRNAYLAERERHLEQLNDACLRFGYSLERLCTDEPMDAALAAFLSLRLARRRVMR